MEQFNEIAGAFLCPGNYLGDEPYGSGHINDTFKAYYDVDGREVHYIHQRVNHKIFKDVPALMENIGNVVRHQRKKFEEAGANDLDRRVLTLIPTVDGKDYYVDSEGCFWRTYVFIEDAVGIDVVETTGQAFEAAKAFGEFQSQLANLPVRLHDTIPNFHHTRSRYDTLMQAIEEDTHGRACNVQAEIAFVKEREELVDLVIDLLASGELPERVTHNDTKLNNVLIDSATGKGKCVIDLDTVMPGSVLYDFGDMVRTTTNQAVEDEPDASKIWMDIDYFEALVSGYLETASGFLTPKEKELLPMSGRLITFEIGLRFLTDYLQGDSYFKTHREGQNMDRCRKQFAMVKSMEEQAEAMQAIVSR
ncbi:phosphotransferase enzyme family protein [Pontiella sulfatireligans]|uniref:N-acetylhexosamine 1-kinase n=1 Tax=Pontiella sulfatireligans TaxID=2750658 RepID=A0A6C2UNR6_9BACT|nr:aminoglycoside phosphotransferase family protein [Pontiella sulfatireligans]VGO21905.1 N-acetylhexosamine 1-kinase [Pontiella sulfatireligans]